MPKNTPHPSPLPSEGRGNGGASTFDVLLPKRALFTEIFAAKQGFWMFVVQRTQRKAHRGHKEQDL
jgi:hypothetical protein